MMKIKETEFEGFQVVQLSAGGDEMHITISAGPRILGFSRMGGENSLAVLPGMTLPYPGDEEYWLIGGHRLWYAPEVPARTYIPDNQPVSWREVKNGVLFIQPVDLPTGIRKSLQINYLEETGRWRIEHILENHGEGDLELAPWAVTQMRKGGIAILPLSTDNADEFGLLPNRQVIFWPYTDLDSGYLEIRNEAVMLKSSNQTPPTKIGAPNPRGWLAYALDSQLFIKWAEFRPGGSYLDLGASSQIYCNQHFLELETLGPVFRLLPGNHVNHIEEWELLSENDWPEEAARLLTDSK